MSKLALTLVLATSLSASLALPASAGDGSSYDGTWSVVLVTESGMCDARYNTALSVQGGQVRPVSNAGSNGATVTGRVGADGSVGLSVAKSGASGSASGRLQAQSGSGTWQVSSLCTGRWTARRQNQRTAQAN